MQPRGQCDTGVDAGSHDAALKRAEPGRLGSGRLRSRPARAAAMLLAAFAALVTLPLQAQAQTEIWSGTLTVRDSSGVLGCSNGFANNFCSDYLNDDDFTHDSTDYAFTTIFFRSTGRLEIAFDTTLTTATQGLTLNVDGTAFTFESADSKTNTDRSWNSSGLSWTAGSTVSLTLTEPPTASTDATLSALALDGAPDGETIALIPVFDAATDAYTALVANRIDAVTLTATKNDSTATVAITSDDNTNTPDEAVLSLAVGANTLTVTVTAADTTTTQTYTITVTRAAAPPAPTDCPADTAWCGTLGVGFSDLSPNNSIKTEIWGYRRDASYGDLSPVTFSHGGTSYTVAYLYRLNSTSGGITLSDQLILDVSLLDFPDGTVLQLGSRTFTVDTDSDTATPGQEQWDLQANPLDWTAEQHVTASLKFPDTTAPAFESAAADGASLVITFDEDLAAAASLANSAFTVEKTPSGGVEDTVTLSTTAPAISGKTVTLTLAAVLVSTDGSVKVSYNKPTAGSANKLADAAGNETASFTDQTVTNNTVASDRAALIALYNATDGANWTDNTNWLSNKALSEWNGVSTDRYDRVTRLYLPENELSGEIPVELGGLAYLQELWLNHNMLSGEIPVELGNLTSLTLLWLDQNMLRGEIPVELGNLTNLQQLTLSDNMLTGGIPAELGKLTDLYVLSLWGNMLSGEIPEELGNLALLLELYLNRNELSGTIPVDLGKLASSGLWYLDLSQNMLTGGIPAELGKLTSLQKLYLWDNELTGGIPAELGKLTLLQVLSLSQNMLSGMIPEELGNLASLQYLYLWGNELSGEIPAGLGNLTNLKSLSLSQNMLTGGIPAGLGSLTNLQLLYLSQNELRGEIPAGLGNLTSLLELYLYDNGLTGDIPAELGSLTSLSHLALWDNPDLAGPVPVAVGVAADRAALVAIYLANGGASWTNAWVNPYALYDPLSNWSGVTTGASGRVTHVQLGNRGLAGPVTAAFEVLTDLQELSLNDNVSLYGTLPVRLQELASLAKLDVRNTSVCTPAETAFQTWLATITFQGTPCPAASFAESTYSATEGGPAATVTIRLSAAPGRELTIPLTATPAGGATEDDYTVTPAIVTFRSMDTEATVEITAVADSVSEVGHEVVLGFQRPVRDNGTESGHSHGDADRQRPPPPPPPVPDAPTICWRSEDEQVTLMWEAPEDDGGSAITDYEYRIDQTGEWISIGSTDTTHTVTGLVNGTEYVFQVRAVTAAGSSAPSNRVEATPRAAVTLLVANFMNGNNGAFNSRVYLWNPSTSAGQVTVRVFTLPLTTGIARELTGPPLDLGTLEARSALNLKLVEDILDPLGIALPYTTDGGNLMLEFTIQAVDVRGAAQVFSSDFAFGTYPMQEIPSTSSGSPTVLVANFTNGNNGALNSRVYLWNPSATDGHVTVRVFTLPNTGDSMRLQTVPLGILKAFSARNIRIAEDILGGFLGIALPYTDDGGNLMLEFTIEAPDVKGAAQVFSSDFAFGTYPLQEIPSTSSGSPTVLVANFTNGNNGALHSRVYLWNPSASAGEVTVRVFTLPLTGNSSLLGTLDLESLQAESARNLKLAEDILAPLGIALPYVTDGGNLTLEFTIQAADARGVAQVFSSDFAFGTYPMQEIPSTSIRKSDRFGGQLYERKRRGVELTGLSVESLAKRRQCDRPSLHAPTNRGSSPGADDRTARSWDPGSRIGPQSQVGRRHLDPLGIPTALCDRRR